MLFPRTRSLFRCLAAALLLGAASASANVAPEFIEPAPSPTLNGGAHYEVDLRTLFRDPDVPGSAVRVNYRIGSVTKPVEIALFDEQTPITVANFLAYVEAGRTNANFIHRSVPGFVVQGGGFAWGADGVESVPTFPPIQNEPGISNLRGTVAMAKLGGDPNSATSQWFVNLADNSANLDEQNGGFTVFGRVLGTGMSVIDEIAALPRYNVGGAFDSLPLKDYGTGNIQRVHTVETNSEIVPTLSFSANADDRTLVDVTLQGSVLRVTAKTGRSGVASISLAATDLEGATTRTSFNVEVLSDDGNGNGNGSVESTLVVSAARTGAALPQEGSAGMPANSVMSAFGTPAISDDRSLAARVTISSGRSRLAGIYWEDQDRGSKLVAVQNQPSGVPNATFRKFRDPVLAPNGSIAFAASLRGVGKKEDDGVWTDLFGNLEPVLREGAEIPGLGGLKLKSVTSLVLTDDALLARVSLLPAPGGVTEANNTALVRITGPTAGTLLVRTGASFDGSTIKQLSVLQPAAGSAGQGRWNSGSDTLAKLTLADRRSVIVRLTSDGAQISLLDARPGNPAPESGLAKLGLPALGGAGVAVVASRSLGTGVTAANDSVLLYAADGVNFTEAVSEGAGAANFDSFSDPVANDQGEVLFFGARRAAAPRMPDTAGLWITDGASAPDGVAQIGAAAVDQLGAALAETVWSRFISFALPDGPGAGAVFVAQVRGRAVNGQNKLGVWAVDSNGVLKQVLRSGQEVTVNGGVKRIHKFALLNSLSGSFGARRSYNANGSLAVLATFTDRTQAILRVDVP